ncbi:MAG: hypothetical protein CMC88_04320 [Flavobacteriaceae bacterium]|nr:hypothetical protein [Flavobacteriaceae bacterium]
MKIFLKFFFIIQIFSLIIGFYYKTYLKYEVGDKIIGFTVLIGVFIFMPLFLYDRWNGKKLKDYTLTEENIKKIKNQLEFNKRKKKN